MVPLTCGIPPAAAAASRRPSSPSARLPMGICAPTDARATPSASNQVIPSPERQLLGSIRSSRRWMPSASPATMVSLVAIAWSTYFRPSRNWE